MLFRSSPSSSSPRVFEQLRTLETGATQKKASDRKRVQPEIIHGDSKRPNILKLQLELSGGLCMSRSHLYSEMQQNNYRAGSYHKQTIAEAKLKCFHLSPWHLWCVLESVFVLLSLSLCVSFAFSWTFLVFRVCTGVDYTSRYRDRR